VIDAVSPCVSAERSAAGTSSEAHGIERRLQPLGLAVA